MKQTFFLTGILGALLVFGMSSCVSATDRTIPKPEIAQTEILGTVSDSFTSFQWFNMRRTEAVKKTVYERLLKKAQEEWGPDVDVRNIVIKGGFSGWQILWSVGLTALGAGIGTIIDFAQYEAQFDDDGYFQEDPNYVPYASIPIGTGIGLGTGLLSGNFQKITATGDIVALSKDPQPDETTEPSQRNNDITDALENAAQEVITSLQEKKLTKLKIAIVNVSSSDAEVSEYVAGDLESLLVKNDFIIVDRSELDRIRREQNFQLSGDVDDDQIVSVGKFAGAGIVITGRITGSGSMRRLRLRAIDVQSAEVKASSSQGF